MPYVTGTSVLGLTYKDGVIIASDMLGEFPTESPHSIDGGHHFK
jgi:hypothetical protein